MRKQELVKAIADQTNLSEAKVNEVVTAVFANIESALTKGEEVALSGFGSFKVTERPAREGRNPQTGASIKIPARKSPTFKPGAGLKRSVGGV